MTDRSDELRRFFGIKSGDTEHLLRVAADAYVEGDLADAERILRGLLRLSSEYAPAAKLLASTLLQMGQTTEAADLYAELHAIDPDDPFVTVTLGELKLKTMQFSEALPLLRGLIEADPEFESPTANRARALVVQYAEALKAAGHTE